MDKAWLLAAGCGCGCVTVVGGQRLQPVPKSIACKKNACKIALYVSSEQFWLLSTALNMLSLMFRSITDSTGWENPEDLMSLSLQSGGRE